MEQNTQPRWYQGKMFNGGVGALDFGLTYADRRSRIPEESKFKSASVAAVTASAWMYIPGVMWAKTALDVGKGVGGAVEGFRRQSYEDQFSMNDSRGVIGKGFMDSDIGYTSRQRGMQAIQSSRLNAQSALANEARSLHRF